MAKRTFPGTHDLTTTAPVAIPTATPCRILQAMVLVGICDIRNEKRGLIRGNDKIETASQWSSLLEGKSLRRIGHDWELWGGVEMVVVTGSNGSGGF